MKKGLAVDTLHEGDARELVPRIAGGSVAVSLWSPPYFVGKSYEAGLSFGDWQALLRDVIAAHRPVIRPGGFLVVNIADILCFRDPSMPRISAETPGARRHPVTREMVLQAMSDHPGMNRRRLAERLGCSEQTIDRRLNGNNVRGGKYDSQTRVRIVGGLVEEWAAAAGFYAYDRRVWVKDACWENSRWASISYRAVDEFEYLYVFWKPGVTKVDRSRLSRREWREWGSRGVWTFPSVRRNDDHEAKFPVELPTRVIRLLTGPGDVVLDCFMGSGTTAVAAARLGRRFIGIEIEPRYVDLSRRRLAEEKGPPARRRRVQADTLPGAAPSASAPSDLVTIEIVGIPPGGEPQSLGHVQIPPRRRGESAEDFSWRAVGEFGLFSDDADIPCECPKGFGCGQDVEHDAACPWGWDWEPRAASEGL